MQLTSYTLPLPLVQAIVNVLNQQPAGVVRPLLNDIEAYCAAQDGEHATKVAAALAAATSFPPIQQGDAP